MSVRLLGHKVTAWGENGEEKASAALSLFELVSPSAEEIGRLKEGDEVLVRCEVKKSLWPTNRGELRLMIEIGEPWERIAYILPAVCAENEHTEKSCETYKVYQGSRGAGKQIVEQVFNTVNNQKEKTAEPSVVERLENLKVQGEVERDGSTSYTELEANFNALIDILKERGK